MKLFSQKGKPIPTASPGNDGSKLPIVKSLSPGSNPVIEMMQHPEIIERANQQSDLHKEMPFDDPVRHGGVIGELNRGAREHPDPRLDLSQYRRRVPIERPVQFEQGEILIIEGCKFRIVYIRSNPSRMTLEAV